MVSLQAFFLVFVLAATLFPGACRACRYSGSQSEPTFVFRVCVCVLFCVVCFVMFLSLCRCFCVVVYVHKMKISTDSSYFLSFCYFMHDAG